MTDPDQTWQSMTDPSTGGPRVLAVAFSGFHADLKKYDVRHPFFAPAFLRATDVVIRAAMTGQDVVASALCKELSPFAREIADTAPGSTLDQMDTPNLAALAVFHLERSFGRTGFGPEPTEQQTDTLLARLAVSTRFGEGQRETAILALMIHGETDAARRLAGLGPLPPFFAAFLEPQGAASLWPAWRDRFPARVRANAVFWHQMLFVARSLADADQTPAAWLLAQVR